MSGDHAERAQLDTTVSNLCKAVGCGMKIAEVDRFQELSAAVHFDIDKVAISADQL